MSETMVWRVAVALVAHDEECAPEAAAGLLAGWRDCADAEIRALYDDRIRAARAAIAALGEPTEAMIAAGTLAVDASYDLHDDHTLAIWQAAIDAALNEEPPG